MRLASNEITEDIEKNIEERIEIDKLRSRISVLESEIDNEKNIIKKIESEITRVKPEFILACILIGVSILILFWLATNAMSIVATLFSVPIIFVVIIGILVSFLAYTAKYVAKSIPMYIYCELEKKGKTKNDTNYVYQLQKHINKCKQLELELEEAMLNFDEKTKCKVV